MALLVNDVYCAAVKTSHASPNNKLADKSGLFLVPLATVSSRLGGHNTAL